jgi:hypothetical protein
MNTTMMPHHTINNIEFFQAIFRIRFTEYSKSCKDSKAESRGTGISEAATRGMKTAALKIHSLALELKRSRILNLPVCRIKDLLRA